LLNRNEPFANVLAVVPGWELAYSDNVSVLFVRRANAETAVAKSAHSAAMPEEKSRGLDD
jgi:hypothetical protein